MDVVFRIAFVYLFLLVIFRLLGKRELSQLSPFEFVVLILLPEILTDGMTAGDHSLTTATVGSATLLLLVFLTSVLSHRFRWFEDLTEGESTVLVYKGRFLESNLNRERVQPAEVFMYMHLEGFERLEQVKWAILEDDGTISIIPEADANDSQ